MHMSIIPLIWPRKYTVVRRLLRLQALESLAGTYKLAQFKLETAYNPSTSPYILISSLVLHLRSYVPSMGSCTGTYLPMYLGSFFSM